MSWAAKRRTTRVEDRAYSLLGLFEINMPLLYGEGEKAFLRLQEEIAKNASDLSLFAWEIRCKNFFDLWEKQEFFGIFAPSLDDFQYCGSLVAQRNQFCNLNDFVVTNKGLKIHTSVTLYKISDQLSDRLLVKGMPLWCHKEEDTSKVLGVPLIRTAFGHVRARHGALGHFRNPFPALSTTLEEAVSTECFVYLQPPTDSKRLLISKGMDLKTSNRIYGENSRFLGISLPWTSGLDLYATGFLLCGGTVTTLGFISPDAQSSSVL